MDTADHDKALMIKIAEGDEAAFTELFHSYTPRLLPFVMKLTRNEHQAQEVVQETFLRLWVKREELGKVYDPPGWIFRIASNVAITWLRTMGNRRRLMANVDVREETDETVEFIDSKELGSIIHRAVSQLPARRQEIYRLSREQGLSHQQIANQMEISINTVKNQLGMALKTMQEYISKETGLSLLTLALLLGR